ALPKQQPAHFDHDRRTDQLVTGRLSGVERLVKCSVRQVERTELDQHDRGNLVGLRSQRQSLAALVVGGGVDCCRGFGQERGQRGEGRRVVVVVVCAVNSLD